jgi:hypothetical protein
MPSPIPVIQFQPEGDQSALNVTAASVIKASKGTLCRIIPVVVGSAGNITISDSTSASGNTVANEVITIPVGSLAIGVPVVINWPCANGIALSAIPTGGQYSFSFN